MVLFHCLDLCTAANMPAREKGEMHSRARKSTVWIPMNGDQIQTGMPVSELVFDGRAFTSVQTLIEFSLLYTSKVDVTS